VLPWDFDVELAGYAPVFWNMVEMEMERPWEYSHWRTNSLTGEIYTEPLYARMLAEGWDLDGWMATVTAGPLDWAVVDARVRGERKVSAAFAVFMRLTPSIRASARPCTPTRGARPGRQDEEKASCSSD
jgi:hypothetical protein